MLPDKPMNETANGYTYRDASLSHTFAYLHPVVTDVLDHVQFAEGNRRIFELGCGNGSFADQLSKRGFEVCGVDASEQGIDFAKRHYPHLDRLELGSAYDDLAGRYGRFPVAISLEVVEHVYYPRKFAATLFSLLEDGGVAIVSTPYHGYWKNLALAVTGKLDDHFTALWDHGHIKFWSMRTLRALLEEAGFVDIEFRRAGRIPPLAKSMVAIARRPRGRP